MGFALCKFHTKFPQKIFGIRINCFIIAKQIFNHESNFNFSGTYVLCPVVFAT